MKRNAARGGDLRRALRAAQLAWLFPGAGHLYLGARRRAAVFCTLVLLTVGLGVACDGNLGIIDARRAPVLTTLQVGAHLSLGPLDPLLRLSMYGSLLYREEQGGGSPVKAAALERRRRRFYRPYSNYGSTYLLAAGLMNLLLILDAWDIGIGRRS